MPPARRLKFAEKSNPPSVVDSSAPTRRLSRSQVLNVPRKLFISSSLTTTSLTTVEQQKQVGNVRSCALRRTRCLSASSAMYDHVLGIGIEINCDKVQVDDSKVTTMGAKRQRNIEKVANKNTTSMTSVPVPVASGSRTISTTNSSGMEPKRRRVTKKANTAATKPPPPMPPIGKKDVKLTQTSLRFFEFFTQEQRNDLQILGVKSQIQMLNLTLKELFALNVSQEQWGILLSSFKEQAVANTSVAAIQSLNAAAAESLITQSNVRDDHLTDEEDNPLVIDETPVVASGELNNIPTIFLDDTQTFESTALSKHSISAGKTRSIDQLEACFSQIIKEIPVHRANIARTTTKLSDIVDELSVKEAHILANLQQKAEQEKNASECVPQSTQLTFKEAASEIVGANPKDSQNATTSNSQEPITSTTSKQTKCNLVKGKKKRTTHMKRSHKKLLKMPLEKPVAKITTKTSKTFNTATSTKSNIKSTEAIFLKENIATANAKEQELTYADLVNAFGITVNDPTDPICLPSTVYSATTVKIVEDSEDKQKCVRALFTDSDETKTKTVISAPTCERNNVQFDKMVQKNSNTANTSESKQAKLLTAPTHDVELSVLSTLLAIDNKALAAGDCISSLINKFSTENEIADSCKNSSIPSTLTALTRKSLKLPPLLYSVNLKEATTNDSTLTHTTHTSTTLSLTNSSLTNISLNDTTFNNTTSTANTAYISEQTDMCTSTSTSVFETTESLDTNTTTDENQLSNKKKTDYQQTFEDFIDIETTKEGDDNSLQTYSLLNSSEETKSLDETQHKSNCTSCARLKTYTVRQSSDSLETRDSVPSAVFRVVPSTKHSYSKRSNSFSAAALKPEQPDIDQPTALTKLNHDLLSSCQQLAVDADSTTTTPVLEKRSSRRVVAKPADEGLGKLESTVQTSTAKKLKLERVTDKKIEEQTLPTNKSDGDITPPRPTRAITCTSPAPPLQTTSKCVVSRTLKNSRYHWEATKCDDDEIKIPSVGSISRAPVTPDRDRTPPRRGLSPPSCRPSRSCNTTSSKHSTTPPKRSTAQRKRSATPPKRSTTPPKRSTTPPKRSTTPPRCTATPPPIAPPEILPDLRNIISKSRRMKEARYALEEGNTNDQNQQQETPLKEQCIAKLKPSFECESSSVESVRFKAMPVTSTPIAKYGNYTLKNASNDVAKDSGAQRRNDDHISDDEWETMITPEKMNTDKSIVPEQFNKEFSAEAPASPTTMCSMQLDQDVIRVNSITEHTPEKSKGFNDSTNTISSPKWSPISENEIASPPASDKLSLSEYKLTVEIDGQMSFPPMRYFLYEVDIRDSGVNRPDSFVGLKADNDPRLGKLRKQQPQQSAGDPRLRFNAPQTSAYALQAYQPQHQQAQQQQQTPNMLLYGCLQRSPWYQGLMSTMKIQINQSISTLVAAINNFQKIRMEDPFAVFDIFKIYCAGELLEILENLGLFVDTNAIISEKKNLSSFGGHIASFSNPTPVNSTYSFIQQVVPGQTNATRHFAASAAGMPNTPTFVSCYINSPSLTLQQMPQPQMEPKFQPHNTEPQPQLEGYAPRMSMQNQRRHCGTKAPYRPRFNSYAQPRSQPPARSSTPPPSPPRRSPSPRAPPPSPPQRNNYTANKAADTDEEENWDDDDDATAKPAKVVKPAAATTESGSSERHFKPQSPPPSPQQESFEHNERFGDRRNHSYGGNNYRGRKSFGGSYRQRF